MPRNAACLISLLLVFGLIAVGCGDEDSNPTSSGTDGRVQVIGVVTAIEDLVPVDGGVTVDIVTDSGKSERLLFGSLETLPPPSEEKIALYGVLRRVETDDLVRAEGIRTESGIDLEAISIMSRGY